LPVGCAIKLFLFAKLWCHHFGFCVHWAVSPCFVINSKSFIGQLFGFSFYNFSGIFQGKIWKEHGLKTVYQSIKVEMLKKQNKIFFQN
jgi:hypothetical protein